MGKQNDVVLMTVNELIKYNLDFYLYGFICGYVVIFFENEKMSWSGIRKMTVFGFLTMFSHHLAEVTMTGTTYESGILTVSIGLSTIIYLSAFLIFDQKYRATYSGRLFMFIGGLLKGLFQGLVKILLAKVAQISGVKLEDIADKKKELKNNKLKDENNGKDTKV